MNQLIIAKLMKIMMVAVESAGTVFTSGELVQALENLKVAAIAISEGENKDG